MPTQTINLNDALPAPPAGFQNNKWQADAPSLDPTVVRDVSTYTPLATLSLPGSVKPDGVGMSVDSSGKMYLLGNPLFYKGPFSGSTLYNVGDISTFNGEAWLCISQVDESVAPGMVQAAVGQGNSKAFASNVTAGNLLIVFVDSRDSSSVPTDTLGTAYTLLGSSGSFGFYDNLGLMYYGVAPSSGANTVSFATTGAVPAVAIAEFRGVTPVLNAHASNTAADSLSLTTTQPSMIVIARGEHHSTAATYSGTGGVAIAAQQSDPSGGSGRSLALGYVAEGAAGTYTPGLTASSSSNDVLIAGAFLSNGLSPDVDTAHWLCLGTIEPTGSGNKVIATPADGSSGQAALRALVAADLPALSGTANKVYATPDGASGLTSLRALAAADLPLATAGAFGAVKPDGTSITVSSGVISATTSTPTSLTEDVVTFSGTSGTLAASPTAFVGLFRNGIRQQQHTSGRADYFTRVGTAITLATAAGATDDFIAVYSTAALSSTLAEDVVTFSGTSGTLAHAPTAFVGLFRNGARQQKHSSGRTDYFSISGTAITLGTAAGGSDDFIAVYFY
jgi:hypothetical protein